MSDKGSGIRDTVEGIRAKGRDERCTIKDIVENHIYAKKSMSGKC